jgi:C1A family cysteine protease
MRLYLLVSVVLLLLSCAWAEALRVDTTVNSQPEMKPKLSPDFPITKKLARERDRACLEDLNGCMRTWMLKRVKIKKEKKGKKDKKNKGKSESMDMTTDITPEPLTPAQKVAFAQNVAAIAAINEDPELTWVADYTLDMDLTDEEWRATYLVNDEPIVMGMKKRNVAHMLKRNVDVENSAVDWRDNPDTEFGSTVTNFVTPVRDQGVCGSC